MRILVATAPFYFPTRGADENDRVEGVRQLLRLGHQVQVITRGYDFHVPHMEAARDGLGVEIAYVPFSTSGDLSGPTRSHVGGRRWRFPIVDGSARPYASAEFVEALLGQVSRWRPEVMIVDASFLWPAARIGKEMGIRVLLRSINFEPIHVLQELGYSGSAFLRAAVRLPSEFAAARYSDVILAITPKESNLYRKLRPKKLLVVPLRGLPATLTRFPSPEDRPVLNAFFMGSTFNVGHMRSALEYIAGEVIPLANRKLPGAYQFHVIGGKVPSHLPPLAPENLTYHGWREVEPFVRTMDVALAPSLFGAGMQQKVFEPLCRGMPTITHERALAGYPFENGKHLLTATSTENFVDCLDRLRDLSLRQRLAFESHEQAKTLFSQKVLDELIGSALEG